MVRSDAPRLDWWEPLSLAEAVALFDGAPFRWWISGGRALELHLGESWRDHEDTDVGIVRSDASACFEWLTELRLWVAAGGSVRRWDGGPLASGENNVWAQLGGSDAFCLDITIGAGTPTEWVYRRDPAVRRPWDEVVLVDPSGVPYLAPELQMLFKSLKVRPKDDVDAAVVIPQLSEEQWAFLAGLLSEDHPWLQLR